MNKDIIFLNPVCTHNIWGGTRLNREFGYSIEGDDIGECWGISAHPSGDGTVRNGAFQGMKLSELWEKHPELFGNTGMYAVCMGVLLRIYRKYLVRFITLLFYGNYSYSYP